MLPRLTPLALAPVLCSAASAVAQTGGPYDLSWSTIDSGGGTSNGGSYAISGTIGQPDAGPSTPMTGGPFSLVGGFWPGADDLCDPDCNQSGTLTIADFGCFQAKFASGDPYADCNHNGTLTIADFGCFQAQFADGCP
jgi:hypothetical protein